MPTSFSLTFPELPTICSTQYNFEEKFKQKAGLTHQKAFFDILMHLVEYVYKGRSFVSLKDYLSTIWENDIAITPPNFFSHSISHSPSLKEFLGLISSARHLAILHHHILAKTDAEGELQYFKETQERFCFMKRITDDLGSLLFDPNIAVEREIFLTGIMTDINSNIQCIGGGLYSQYFKKYHSQLVNYGSLAIHMKTKFLNKFFSHLPHDVTKKDSSLVFSIWLSWTFSNLNCAKFYYALGKDELALTHLKEELYCAPEIYKTLPNPQELSQVLSEYVQKLTIIHDFVSKDIIRKHYLILLSCFKPYDKINSDSYSISNGFITKLDTLKKYSQINQESIDLFHEAILFIGAVYDRPDYHTLPMLKSCQAALHHLTKVCSEYPYNVMVSYLLCSLNIYKIKIQTLQNKLQKEVILNQVCEKSLASDCKESSRVLKQRLEELKVLKDREAAFHKKENNENASLKTKITHLESRKAFLSHPQRLKARQDTLTKQALQLDNLEKEKTALLQRALPDHTLLAQQLQSLKAEMSLYKTQQELISKLQASELKGNYLQSSIHSLQTDLKKIMSEPPPPLLTSGNLSALQDTLSNLKNKQKGLKMVNEELQAIYSKGEQEFSTQYERSSQVNSLNVADNEDWQRSLQGFQKVLHFLKEGLALYPPQSPSLTTPPVYTPSVPISNQRHSVLTYPVKPS